MSVERKRTTKLMVDDMEKLRNIVNENKKKLSEEKKKKLEEDKDKKEKKEERLKDEQIKKEKEFLLKKEEERVKNIEKSNILLRKKKIEDYKNRLRMNEIEEKDKKIEEFKNRRIKLTEQRRETSNEIKKQKDLLLLKFDKIMKSNKEIEAKTIKEMFPEDEELYKKVEEMK